MQNHKSIHTLLLLAALLISSAAYSQSIVYTQGNVSIIQYPDTWQITHGSKILAHGNHVIDVENLAPPVQDLIEHYAKLPVTKKRTLKKSAVEESEPEYLIKTHWDQHSPYNDHCPTIDGEHVPAGCLTISSAQVLNYYKVCKPLILDGDLTSPADIQSPDLQFMEQLNDGFNLYHFNYTYTPDFDKINSDNEEVAKFIFAIALAQRAYFDALGSNTSGYNQRGAFDNTFGYDYEICERHSQDEDPKAMEEFIIAALNEKKPVIVSDNARNHSYIIDGYNESTGEYHANLGWGEDQDAWYTADIVGISNFHDALVVKPSDGTKIKLLENPKYRYIKTTAAKEYTRYNVKKEGDYYMPEQLIDITPGEYEFYFEYADGQTIAPTLDDFEPLCKEHYFVERFGVYQRTPATFTVKDNCYLNIFLTTAQGRIIVQGQNFKDPDFDKFNFTLILDGKEYPMNYDAENSEYWVELDLEPGKKSFVFRNNKTKKILHRDYPSIWEKEIIIAYDANDRFGGWCGWASFYFDDDYQATITVSDHAIIGDTKVPCKSTTLRFTVDNIQDTQVEALRYTPTNDDDNYTLTVLPNNTEYGTVTGSGRYGKKSQIDISATAKEGYRFYQWSDGNPDAQRTITLENDMTIEAQFEKAEDIVQVNVQMLGEYDGRYQLSGAHNYKKGETIKIDVTDQLADYYFIFTKWSDGHSEKTRIFVAEEDINLTAYFEKVTIPNKENDPPKSVHIVDSENNDKEYVLVRDNDYDYYWAKTYIENLTKGQYSLYFEFPDGTTAAPITNGGIAYYDNNQENYSTMAIKESARMNFVVDKSCSISVRWKVTHYKSIDINVYEWIKEPVSIVIETMPKTEFIEGGELNIYDGVLFITYDDGTTETTALENAEITGFDNSKIGEQTLTVKYLGLETTLTVTVKEPTPISISISSTPKTEYLQGEEFSYTDGVLLITYNNGTTETTALENAEITGFDNSKIGEQTLTVKYLDLETTLTVTVKEPTPISISLSSTPKTEYLQGEEFSYTDGVLLITYNNGTTETTALENAEITGFDNSKIGEQTLTVKYLDLETTLTVTVSPQSVPISTIPNTSDINVWSYNRTIYIETAPDTKYTIIDTNGRLITTSKTQSTKEEIKINKSGVVIVVIDNQAFKIAL